MTMPRDTLADLSDESLLVLYANSDPDAARLLTGRLLPRVLGYATRLLGDRAEAEDVAQDAMMRLWRIAPDWRAGEEGGLIEADRMAALQTALDSLPDRQRQAVVLRHIEGMTNPEIAAILEIGVEAVESLTARGKRALSLAL